SDAKNSETTAPAVLDIGGSPISSIGARRDAAQLWLCGYVFNFSLRAGLNGSLDGGLGEGFRAPALCDGGACAGAGARKPPKEETAGRTGPFGERDYGDLRVADGWRARRRQRGPRSTFSAEA